jgi:glutathione synthase/RimK-type ligase-like ATP-grasp enzyme
MFDVVILTDHRYINPTIKNWYIDQVLLEDQLLQMELENKGLKVCKKNWADPNFDWFSTTYAIFRTTWDYFERFDEFFTWIDKTKHKTTFINTTEIINWNIDKHYLQDLAGNGINIIPTLFIEKDDKIDLKELFKQTKWSEAVIKPAISGAARHTYRITPNNCIFYEDIFQQLIKEKCMLFQEFMNNITLDGEISLILIGGRYTHSVRKIAKKDDFRVQDDHGGKVVEHKASSEEIKFAKECVKGCPFYPIYARVDMIYNNNNQPSLIELELIEPELWFRNNTEAALLLAEEVFSLIDSK